MLYYTGIDVSLEASHLCVVDEAGTVIKEARVASEPEALVAWFSALGFAVKRIGLEAGPLSQWLYAGLKAAGLEVSLLETRHVRDAFRAMPVKTDRKDARGIAQLMRLGWYRQVHCKSVNAQDNRTLLAARKVLQCKYHDLEMSLRGLLRGYGLKVGETTRKTFEPRVRELAADVPGLAEVAEALLKARAVLFEQFRVLDARMIAHARKDERAGLLMTVPGVGALISLTFVSAIDDPGRFRSSRTVGAHFGLTQRKYQSGETDITGRISKCGDQEVRTALYEAANIILTRPVKGSQLKSWAAKVAQRSGMKKAKVALARKLCVVMHRMLVDGTCFDPALAAA
ncbi:IS110 family transposase [Asticcacaulis excentricus]|uniref:Transposase IS116/IS110/IS902 family protein n=1 Tax=Asticcacaulis excentricus (strain ATCC 15261 / DSM 4724 / KCTC 12464 / NCIMB 9791 / VKM B-1370 / CB 48) TaxID=573065 RepID=E8RPJ5_ASTEC|nr:IS110 family transposase [Asticcacaulis excentricus]ADU13093.1 transposase IS116/IS110/IS902 family protein [Asticcacaulis excentricus CB 48]ADU14089.1 transposase IS116/IS110/IS902 family protein [Asticcacaulis excentricus CB 48]